MLDVQVEYLVIPFEEDSLNCDWDEAEIYMPGRIVPAGVYRQAGCGRVVILEQDGYLPASLDGRVAVYLRPPQTWAQTQLEAVSS